MDKVWHMLNYQHSVKLNDLLLYKESLESMIPLFFTQNRTNYAMYGSVYPYSLVKLPYTHPGANEMIASVLTDHQYQILEPKLISLLSRHIIGMPRVAAPVL